MPENPKISYEPLFNRKECRTEHNPDYKVTWTLKINDWLDKYNIHMVFDIRTPELSEFEWEYSKQTK